MTTLTRRQRDILDEALRNMDDESKNTDRYFARDAKGEVIEADHKRAVCWCYFGHLQKVIGVGDNHGPKDYFDLITFTYGAVSGAWKDEGIPSIGYLNDTKGTGYLRDLVRAALATTEVVD